MALCKSLLSCAAANSLKMALSKTQGYKVGCNIRRNQIAQGAATTCGNRSSTTDQLARLGGAGGVSNGFGHRLVQS